MPRSLIALCLLLTACGPAGKPPAQPPALVDVIAAAEQPVERVVRLLGEATAVDGVMIAAKSGGVITELSFENGAEVAAGQVLVRLDSAREAAAVRAARGDRDKAAKELENRKPLLERGLVSQDEIDRLAAELAAQQGALELAEATLADRTVLAPFAGTIGIRRVGVGSLVAAGTAIAQLVKLDPMQLTFSVPEAQIAALQLGLSVRASTPAWPGRSFTGTVTAIDPGADPRTRSLGAMAVVANPDRALRPGMALTIELVAERIAAAVTVPEGALIMQGGKAFVWCVIDGKAVRTAVQPGVRLPGVVHIVSGLAVGSQVVIQGLQSVRDGQPVQIRPPTTGRPDEKKTGP